MTRQYGSPRVVRWWQFSLGRFLPLVAVAVGAFVVAMAVNYGQAARCANRWADAQADREAEGMREALLQSHQAARDTARALEAAKHEPARGRTWSHTERWRLAEAKTQVTLPAQVWSCTLEVCNQSKCVGLWLNAPTYRVGFGALGGSISILNTNGVDNTGALFVGTPREHEPDDPPPEGELPDGPWWGVYWPFLLSVGAGSSSQHQYYGLYLMDAYGGSWGPTPPDVYELEADSLSIGIAITVSGIKGKRYTSVTPRHVNELSFHERAGGDKWYADQDSQVTVTATGPGGTLQASGPLTGAGEEVDLGANWASTFAFNVYRYHYAGVVYARCADWCDTQGAVDLSNLDLYSPGADAPDSDEPEWGRTQTDENCARIGNDGGAATWWQGTGGATHSATWSGKVWMQNRLTFKPATGKFADDTEYPEIEVYSPAGIEWVWDDEQEKYVQQVLPFTGEHTFVNQWKSWEWEWEYRQIASLDITLYERTAWREEAGEGVDGDDPILNDRQCALLVHPLSATDKSSDPRGEWGAALQIACTPISVVKPPGVTRPAAWSGSGGLTPDPTDNDLWTIAAGSTAPAASLSLASRKLARCARWVAQDPELPNSYKIRALLLINKANVDKVGDDYIDPEEERFPENPWHWENSCYGLLKLVAPRDAVLTVTIQYYGDPAISDPGYDVLDPGEGSVTWGQLRTATWQVAIAKTEAPAEYSYVVFDLAVPQTGEVRPDTYLVTSLRITFPETTEEEEWAFEDFEIGGSYWHDKWGEMPAIDFAAREYDPHDFESDYTGFAALTSGVRALHIPFGYEEYEGIERCLKQRRKSRSRNEELDIFDYAEPLSRLVWMLSVQENFEATYYDPETSVDNQDEDLVSLFGTFRWYDLVPCHEWSWPGDEGCDLGMAPRVGQWSIVAGMETAVYYAKFPQGRAHGIIYRSDRDSLVYGDGVSGRRRYGGSVRLYERATGEEEWSVNSTTTGGGHGDFRLGPGLQKGREYRLTANGGTFALQNRRYHWGCTPGIVKADPDLRLGYCGRCWYARTIEGLPWVGYYADRLGPLRNDTLVVGTGSYKHPSIMPLPDSRLRLACTDVDTGLGIMFASGDDGHQWEVLPMSVVGDLANAAQVEMLGTGIAYVVGIKEGALVCKWSDDGGVTARQFREGGTTIQICTLNLGEGDDPHPTIEVLPDTTLLVAVTDSDGTREYKSADRGETWSLLA